MFTCIICLCIHTSLDYTFIHYISVYSPADDFSIMNLFCRHVDQYHYKKDYSNYWLKDRLEYTLPKYPFLILS